MEKLDLSFLAKTALFKNIPPQEIEVRMGCLGGVVRSFPKGTYIHYAGDIVHTVSMVLKGKVII
ncbi:MAG: Crp/Fnr family transcriptional regulator, partial [Acidaminococcus sp.]|nr:Crp/Fnr family transcriptional regulator [Acidaminococcus sp.]